MKQPFSFCYLRYHHDPVVGEFANVGLLLWGPTTGTLKFYAEKRFTRLSQFFGSFHSSDYVELINRLQTRFDALSKEMRESGLITPMPEAESARDIALTVIPEDDGAIRWSPSQGGMTENPEKLAEEIFHQTITSHHEGKTSERQNDEEIYIRHYKKAFEAPEVKKHVSPKRIEAIFPHEFGQAWKNGVWNVYETLSFDYKRSDQMLAKASRWDSQSRQLAQAEKGLKINFLLGDPRDEHRKTFGKVKDILALQKDVELITEDQAADFAADLKQKIKSAST